MPWVAAQAQSFPNRGLTIIVPYPAGGANDAFARAIGNQMALTLGKPVVIENKSGASGMIGAEAVSRSAADGHTLLYTTSTIALAGLTTPNVKFKPQRDLMALTQTISIPQVLVVHSGVQAKSAAELVAASKLEPGKMTYASGGQGSAGHMAMELFALKSGLDVRHIPYRGAAPAVNALLAGEVDMAILVTPVVKSQIKAGRLRALGMSSATRSPAMPKVPTLRELGFKDYEALQWHGFFLPNGTPEDVVKQLHGAVVQALESPAIKTLLVQEGATAIGSLPAAFKAVFAMEVNVWSDLIKQNNLKFD